MPNTAPKASGSAPYWWEAAPLRETVHSPVAPTADVAIVGAGYTGLAAAIALARAGRSVLVFDRQRPGEGASTRNGGIASGNLRLGLGEMTRRFGEARALAIHAEAKAAREDLYRFVRDEGIDYDFALTGRFSPTSTTAAACAWTSAGCTRPSCTPPCGAWPSRRAPCCTPRSR